MPVTNLTVDGKKIILIGTVHVSRQSAEEVRTVIEEEQPDSVCVELCQSRYESITDRDKWKNTDIIKIIKEKKAGLLFVNLLLSSFQKRIASKIGVIPGLEMIEGIKAAKDNDAQLVLADRDIQVTFMRIWRGISFFGKMRLLFMLLFSIFQDEEISEEELERLKEQDMLTAALDELAASFPELKESLINERDKYLAQKIKEAPGQKVVAVLGAGHVPGIVEQIKVDHDLAVLTHVPKKMGIEKVIGWAIPILIIALIVSTFTLDKATGMDQLLSWILWNGSLAAIGTVVAFGHPLAVLTAFLAAPITSLNPLLAAGWFAGLAETYIRRPNVDDFERLPEDIATLKGFWRNKVTHVLLVVVLANLGSTLGTVIAGADIIRLFLKAITG
ncbi:MAG TPA: TraB/GumN family protein [Clostridia bacterium]|nr:TraB/GumN family protein [Clostridia bacterium]